MSSQVFSRSGVLTAGQLLRRFALLSEDELATLLKSRPDLLYPPPSDLASLAARANSQVSLRQAVERLSKPGLLALIRAARAAERGEPLPLDSSPAPSEFARLARQGLLFPQQAEGGGAQDFLNQQHAEVAVPANLPDLLDSLDLPSPERDTARPKADGTLRADALSGIPTDAPATHEAAPAADGTASATPLPIALVRNASLAAVTELLSGMTEILAALSSQPASTLRTSGVGMRELKRLTVERTGQPRPDDAEIGETGWFLELAASAGLIELNADTSQWSPTPLAGRWQEAPRHRQHQLLTSGWLLSPRSPLLLRGPHPAVRLAPVLSADRQRGDAPALRQRILLTMDQLLRTAPGTTSGTDAPAAQHTPAEAYALQLPDDDLPSNAALRGALTNQLEWEHPVATHRVLPVLPYIVREAERLGLFAVGTLSEAGSAFLRGLRTDPSEDDHAVSQLAPGLSALADYLSETLPPLVETVHFQSDLTAMAAGTLSAEVASGLSDMAHKETRGGVPTYRFSAESLRSALDRGWSPGTIREFLDRYKLAELPSPLLTLIDDVARNWQSVRVGPAGSWILESDESARAELLTDPELVRLGIRALTHEVLICDAPPGELARALKNLGKHIEADSPALDPAPSSRTQVSGSAEAWQLSRSPWQQSPVRSLTPETLSRNPEVLERALSALRRSSGTPSEVQDAAAIDEASASDVLGMLRTAIRQRMGVRITRVTANGEEHTLSGRPLAVSAGRVRVRMTGSDDESVLLVHRITSVEWD